MGLALKGLIRLLETYSQLIRVIKMFLRTKSVVQSQKNVAFYGIQTSRLNSKRNCLGGISAGIFNVHLKQISVFLLFSAMALLDNGFFKF